MDRKTVLEKIDFARERQSTQLHLNNYGLTRIPDEVSELTHLIKLTLGDNKLNSLPDSFRNLKALNWLNLSFNLFEEIPPILFELPNLRELSIGANLIKTLPEDLNLLRQFTDIKLQKNRISKINFNISNVDVSRAMHLEGNPLLDPPYYIAMEGTLSIFKYIYHKEQESVFKIPLDENIRTAIKQYLVYFNDFVAISKGKHINFETSSYNEGIELKLKVNSTTELEEIKKYLQEYISFIKTNIDNIRPEFDNQLDKTQQQMMIIELKNQIRNLQSTVEIRNVQLEYLNMQTDRLYHLLETDKKNPHTITVKNEANAFSMATSRNDISIAVKNEIPVLQKELQELKGLISDISGINTIKELETIESKLVDIEVAETTEIDKVPFKRLKKVLDEINNEDSTLGKAFKAAGKTFDAAKKLAKTYNKFAQWLALPQVPDIFIE